MGFCDDIRRACGWVAAHATHVRIEAGAIEAYAATLPGPAPAPEHPLDEARCAASLQLNAVNFGSGWFPTLRKPPGLSGFRTVEAGLRARGPWTARELCGLGAAEVASTLGQDPGHELMELFARALRELGEHAVSRHGGSFRALAGVGGGAVEPLAQHLGRLGMWRDVAAYGGRPVPFYKRAQIAAGDLHPAAPDIGRLTLFADNLVPHVLRLDGVLRFAPGLVARIERGKLLDPGSPEEVEIRACAVHAVELLVAAHGATTAHAVDHALWHRGAGARYKARPRHRARCTAY